jgi:DNA-binding GntR family transcriptional regulator
MMNPKERTLAIRANRRLVDQVYDRLRSAIVTGYFDPGSRLVERDLTTSLDVSRTPIREALKRLETDGLIVCYPHRGYFVRQPTFEEARQAYELRRALEGLAGELAAARATDQELAAMREVVERAALVLKAGDRSTLLLHNRELHLLIARASHNTFLETQITAIWSYVDLLRGNWWAKTERPETGHREHEELIEVLAKHDSQLARAAFEEHVDRAWRNIARRFDGNGNRPQRSRPPETLSRQPSKGREAAPRGTVGRERPPRRRSAGAAGKSPVARSR